MRNLKLVDAVIQLHDIAHLVLTEAEDQVLHDALRKCADRLHRYSIADDKASKITQEIIKQVKE
jgi:hypothetical protein